MYKIFFCDDSYLYLHVELQYPYKALKKAFYCLRHQQISFITAINKSPKALFQNQMLRLLGKVLHVRVNQIYCLVTFKQIERHDYNTWFAVHIYFTGRSHFYRSLV